MTLLPMLEIIKPKVTLETLRYQQKNYDLPYTPKDTKIESHSKKKEFSPER